IAEHPQVGVALARVATEWLSGQPIAGTDLGRAIKTEVRAVVATDPQLGNVLVHIAADWRLGHGIDGVDTSRLKLVDGPERPAPSGAEPPTPPEAPPAETSDRHGPLSAPVTPLAGAVQFGLRAVLEVPGAEWLIAFSGAKEPS